MKSCLMISPYFVPMNYVGAKRALCFARHLPELGWSSAVVALPDSIEQDPDLQYLVPDVPMYRGFRSGPLAWVEDLIAYLRPAQKPTQAGLKTKKEKKEPGPLARSVGQLTGTLSTAYDKWSKYLPSSFFGSLYLLKKEKCSAIYVNAGPFSAIELGNALARVTGLPLILDLRDPWSIEPNYKAARTEGAQRLVERRERICFSRAAKIILNTEQTLKAYLEVFDGVLPADKFSVIRNHFDAELYEKLPKPPGTELPFRLVYYGHLRPNKDALIFLKAVRRLIDVNELAPGELIFTTLGDRTDADNLAIDELKLQDYTQNHPWMPFPKSVELLGRADLLIDLMGPNHYLQISGKFYDYLACGRPILSVSPNPEMDAIYEATNSGRRVDNDIQVITDALTQALKDKRNGQPFAPDVEAVAEFSALPAARKLAAILDEVVQ
jgi:glycosyltransferase involved in cell wall biosynthesis